MKVLFLTKYHKEGSSSRYRYYNYSKYFEQNGINVEFSPLLYNGYVSDIYNNGNFFKRKFKLLICILKRVFIIIKSKFKYDMFIIEKELFTYVPFIIEKILLLGTPYWLDYDDNPIFKYNQNKILKFFLGSKINNLAIDAVGVTGCNCWYESLFKRNVNFHYLPTVVAYRDYLNQSPEIDSIFKIVWIGSPPTGRYLHIIEDALSTITQRYSNVVVFIIGARPVLKKVKLKYIEWNEETEIFHLSNANVGIMPLEDTDWEKGKCGFKLIQYMAAGLPVIASPAPSNNRIINEEVGFIANDINDWINYIEVMITNEALRLEMGRKARERIRTNYSYEEWGPKFVKLIKSYGK